MKKITMLVIQDCPYCAQAKKAIAEVNPNAAIEIIDENLQPELASKYGKDYYYVPSMFVDDRKIYEAHPGESYEECLANVKKVFEVANGGSL